MSSLILVLLRPLPLNPGWNVKNAQFYSAALPTNFLINFFYDSDLVFIRSKSFNFSLCLLTDGLSINRFMIFFVVN